MVPDTQDERYSEVYGVSEHVGHERKRKDGHESHHDAPESPDQPSMQSVHHRRPHTREHGSRKHGARRGA